MYKCNECGAEKADLSALKRHLRDAHPFVYTCKYCQGQYKGYYKIKDHLYARHGVELA